VPIVTSYGIDRWKIALKNELLAGSTVEDRMLFSLDANQTARVALHKKLTE
jgi:hypothetical protein